ncbi:hypothetical protein EV646_10222 [Kribbella antiqua]|uniref:Uncharacterized protein n=1 Tax=Kribbella antiqua TaxID=2512217 RepID=A0A4R2IW01_9ACTN|nr:hypothetical protein EV646_10222 [Kribbella antiqua]
MSAASRANPDSRHPDEPDHILGDSPLEPAPAPEASPNRGNVLPTRAESFQNPRLDEPSATVPLSGANPPTVRSQDSTHPQPIAGYVIDSPLITASGQIARYRAWPGRCRKVGVGNGIRLPLTTTTPPRPTSPATSSHHRIHLGPRPASGWNHLHAPEPPQRTGPTSTHQNHPRHATTQVCCSGPAHSRSPDRAPTSPRPSRSRPADPTRTSGSRPVITSIAGALPLASPRTTGTLHRHRLGSLRPLTAPTPAPAPLYWG